MPADLVPNEAIPLLAARVSPEMFKVLWRLQQAGFILNGRDVDQETADTLQRLTALGLVDPSYDGPTNGKPLIWVSDHNGERVLRYALESKLKVNPRARTALESQSAREQLAVLWAAESLQSHEPGCWPKEGVVRLGEDKPVYLLPVLPDLRAFIRVLDSGAIELFDIVREETLQLFLERYGAGSKAG
jgi:hypothetical protein